MDSTLRAPMMIEVLRACAQYFGINLQEIKSDSRNMRTVHARHVAMFLCRIDARKSYPEIGNFFGKDHTTVIAADRKIFALREAKAMEIERDLAAVRQILRLAIAPSVQLPQLPLTLLDRLPPCKRCELLALHVVELTAELATARQEIAVLRVRFGCD